MGGNGCSEFQGHWGVLLDFSRINPGWKTVQPPRINFPPFPKILRDLWEFTIPNVPYGADTRISPFGEGRSRFLPWKTKRMLGK